MKTIFIYSLPFESRLNTYFSLWQESLSQRGVIVLPVPRAGLIGLLFGRMQARIICIHWSTVLYGSRFALKSLILLFLNFKLLLLLKLFKRYRVVWVMHNRFAHDYPHPGIDRLGRWLLMRTTDAVVAQQESTYQALTAAHQNKIIVYAPHGNYIDAYGPMADRASSRLRFGFKEDDIVILSLGAIRPYKKTEEIMRAFRNGAESVRLRLWIAGKGAPDDTASLRAIAQDDMRVRIDNSFVPDKDIPAVLACADYAACYYDDSELTSGALVLALSYGVPVLTRDFAGAERVENGKNGYLYEDTEDLAALLKRLPTLPAFDRADVRSSVVNDSWETVADIKSSLFSDLLKGQDGATQRGLS